MKLALIGTHGTGKTTLAYEVCWLLKKSGHSVELVTEVARRSPFPVNEATTLDGQLWILHAQIAAELDAAARAPHVICDRSVLDNYCYLVNKFGRQRELEPWLARWIESYSLLVSVPPTSEVCPSDGFRSENVDFRWRIHHLVEQMVETSAFIAARERITRLKADERYVWGESIFRAASAVLDPPIRLTSNEAGVAAPSWNLAAS